MQSANDEAIRPAPLVGHANALLERVPRPTVLIVDDDVGTRDTFQAALRALGLLVDCAASGSEAIELAMSTRFEIAVLDLRLPDISGTDVVRSLRALGRYSPFILISAFLTTGATVEAMRLGAVDVLDKPIALGDLCTSVLWAIGLRGEPKARARFGLSAAPAQTDSPAGPPRSAAERWALLVLKGCDADGDPKTLDDWASCAGVSYTSLTECCRILSISPHDARDLTRVLRAVRQARVLDCSVEALLNVADRRTLKALMARAGLDDRLDVRDVSVDEVLTRQRFVDRNHEGVRLLQTLFHKPTDRDPRMSGSSR